MKLLTSVAVLSLIGFALAAPTSNNTEDDEKITLTKDFYITELVKYTAEHDIVNLLLPLNAVNFDQNESSESESNSKEKEADLIIFFVEADVDADGKRVDKGLYVLKENKATLLLENGRDAAASYGTGFIVFGAKDGIYVYNKDNNTAEKYGTVDDSIISIAKEKTGDIIYILTENREVYKVSENGNKKEKIDDIVNAKEIVLDLSNNLYFYSDDKQAYVRTAEGIKKIEGLPVKPNNVRLIKPLFVLNDSVPFNVDNNVYIIHSNGSIEESGFEFAPDANPTAYAPEGVLIQYYAYDKKIYEYNVLALIISELIADEIKNYLDEKKDALRSLATKSKIQSQS